MQTGLLTRENKKKRKEKRIECGVKSHDGKGKKSKKKTFVSFTNSAVSM